MGLGGFKARAGLTLSRGCCAERGIVLIVSSGASAAAVVGAVQGNTKLTSRVYLERIVTIVNATSMLCPGNLAHEQSVVAQCAPGIVASIVLVNIEAVADQVDEMRQRLRCINPLAVVICAVAGRVTATRDMESLFLLNEGQEPWFEREKVRRMREHLYTSSFFAHQLQAEDAWSSRRGGMTQIDFTLPREAVFIRPNLVRAIRSLFVSPRGGVEVVCMCGRVVCVVLLRARACLDADALL
jgi:G3E family GTPase